MSDNLKKDILKAATPSNEIKRSSDSGLKKPQTVMYAIRHDGFKNPQTLSESAEIRPANTDSKKKSK